VVNIEDYLVKGPSKGAQDFKEFVETNHVRCNKIRQYFEQKQAPVHVKSAENNITHIKLYDLLTLAKIASHTEEIPSEMRNGLKELSLEVEVDR